MDGSTPKLLNGLTNTAASIKDAPGQVCWYEIYNPSAAAAYVQLFDKLHGSVTLGTDVPALSLGVPAGGRISGETDKVRFQTAISAAATTTAEGSTAPATALVANFGFR